MRSVRNGRQNYISGPTKASDGESAIVVGAGTACLLIPRFEWQLFTPHSQTHGRHDPLGIYVVGVSALSDPDFHDEGRYQNRRNHHQRILREDVHQRGLHSHRMQCWHPPRGSQEYHSSVSGSAIPARSAPSLRVRVHHFRPDQPGALCPEMDLEQTL